MTTQGDPFDPALDPNDTLGADTLPEDTSLSDDQIDDLNQAGNRGDYGDPDLGDRDDDVLQGIHSDDPRDDDGDEPTSPDNADPTNADQGADSGVAGSGI